MTGAEIMQALIQASAAQEKIRLLNIYKGVPIAYEATLEQAGDASLVFKTNPHQIVCLYREKSTYFQCAALPGVVRAQVRALEPANLLAELFDFTPVPEGVGDRRQVRVQTEEPLKSGVFTPGMGEAFEAELADLSADGVAVYIPRRNFYPTVYRRGVKIKITLRLPGEFEVGDTPYAESPGTKDPLYRFSRDALRIAYAPGVLKTTGKLEGRRRIPFPELEIHGNIVNMHEETAMSRVRVGVRIIPGDPARPYVQTFISQRQAEIVREIQALYRVIAA
ncbi:MAG: hypothetical protein L0Z70_15845 [Chloroflexi bacterium]|nr:hypothetical protein [Chloroflexota bacterium]